MTLLNRYRVSFRVPTTSTRLTVRVLAKDRKRTREIILSMYPQAKYLSVNETVSNSAMPDWDSIQLLQDRNIDGVVTYYPVVVDRCEIVTEHKMVFIANGNTGEVTFMPETFIRGRPNV